ncbi:protein TolQ [Iodobacter fluviatilis]|uniref:Tol-Pal system protein TolQ n=1 Tax=Iodobacter fluviatilis TaxID=537 RepID=A0A377SRM4_9NEIS|nr:protein TolQ [Iodobacter fluviatilis]TCU86303.1 cell division and transport-associated protein TolQ [Iodobacter fluviatilis]STR44714.1 colicin uptake protein TolQ [Iodobacter fluviatilis]
MDVAAANQDLSIITLVLHASPVVQAVMGILLIMSFMSWWYIFSKHFSISHARKQTEEFENRFWNGADLATLYDQVRRGQTLGMEKIFQAGFGEFLKLRQRAGERGSMELSDVMEGSRRAMRAACQRELDELDAHTAFLATVGSISPYIGLFGTVWGIMNAFTGLANVGQATLATVAPGIAEALVATAIGLFAAIPAVVAYNRFANEVDKLANRFDTFIEEFSNILQRQVK